MPLASSLLVRFCRVASVETPIRAATARRCSSNSGPSSPSRPLTVQALLISGGGERQTIELITVPPPSVAPARSPSEPSLEKNIPPRMKRSRAPTSSSWRKSDSFRYPPRSRTITDSPAACSVAATTDPPAPEPTTHTSASSVAPGRTRSTRIVFGASSGEGGAVSGPGYPSASQFGLQPWSSLAA